MTTTRIGASATPGSTLQGAYSDDGMLLAYASTTHGWADGRLTQDIGSMDFSGEHRLRAVTTTLAPQVPGSAAFPAWAPGGDQIAYIAYLEEGPEPGYELRVRDLQGVRLLAHHLSLGPVAWSPDGTQLAFAAGGQIELLGLNTLERTPVTQAEAGSRYPMRSDPAWSPDGGRLAYIERVASDAPPCLWWMNADGSQPVRVTQDALAPDWSPDGQKLVYISYRSGQEEVWIRDAVPDGAAGAPDPSDKRLTESPAGQRCGTPRWRPLPLPPAVRIARAQEAAMLLGLGKKPGSAPASTALPPVR